MTPMMKEVLFVIVPIGITMVLLSFFLFAILLERSRKALLILFSCLFFSILTSFYVLSNLPYSNQDLSINIRADITCVKYTYERPDTLGLLMDTFRKLKKIVRDKDAKYSKGVN